MLRDALEVEMGMESVWREIDHPRGPAAGDGGPRVAVSGAVGWLAGRLGAGLVELLGVRWPGRPGRDRALGSTWRPDRQAIAANLGFRTGTCRAYCTASI